MRLVPQLVDLLQVLLLHLLVHLLLSQSVVYLIEDGHSAVAHADQKQHADNQRQEHEDRRVDLLAHPHDDEQDLDQGGDGHVGDEPVVVVVPFVGLLDQHHAGYQHIHDHRHDSFHVDTEHEDEAASHEEPLYEHEAVELGGELLVFEVLDILAEVLWLHDQEDQVHNYHQQENDALG